MATYSYLQLFAVKPATNLVSSVLCKSSSESEKGSSDQQMTPERLNGAL